MRSVASASRRRTFAADRPAPNIYARVALVGCASPHGSSGASKDGAGPGGDDCATLKGRGQFAKKVDRCGRIGSATARAVRRPTASIFGRQITDRRGHQVSRGVCRRSSGGKGVG